MIYYYETPLPWVVAYKKENDSTWRFYASFDDLGAARRAHEMCKQDATRLEVAVIRNHKFNGRPDWSPWWEHAPRFYADRRDHSQDPIAGLSGLISSLPSNYF